RPLSTLFRTPSFFELSDTEWMPWQPLGDFEETDDEFILRLDLPGMKKKDIHVSIQNNVLSVQGERKREEESKDKSYHVRQRMYGKFHRSFMLPSSVDENSIDAQYKDGVLTVTIKKKEDAKARQIEIH
ncbi:MAG: Hsp20/alpha crystallin family protein, partial [Calditrichaeota bacterium]